MITGCDEFDKIRREHMKNCPVCKNSLRRFKESVETECREVGA